MIIDKNIPIPAPRQIYAQRGTVSHLVKDLQIGDSYAIPCPDTEAAERSARCAMNMGARRSGFKVTTRKLIENGEAVLRVWRVE